MKPGGEVRSSMAGKNRAQVPGSRIATPNYWCNSVRVGYREDRRLICRQANERHFGDATTLREGECPLRPAML